VIFGIEDFVHGLHGAFREKWAIYVDWKKRETEQKRSRLFYVTDA